MTPVCASCSKPLEVELDPPSSSEEGEEDEELNDGDTSMQSGDDENEETSPHKVPDDVLLPCGDHFHWECLLESYELSTCPSCSKEITTTSSPSSSSSSSQSPPQTHLFVTLTNEGGTQPSLDIYPLLREESYLRAYPEERKSRAFLEFCREGDHRAIAELLHSCSGPDAEEGDKTPEEILIYQDPMGGMESGLHAAVAGGHREVAWMLLLLASDFPELEIPALVFQEAAALGVMRMRDGDGEKVDVRGLRDERGRTAEDVARLSGVVWNGWVGNGRLAMPASS